MESRERRARALEISQEIAAEYGVRGCDPVILKDTNHTIVHLRPSPIVAKVSMEKRFRPRSSSLEREIRVAEALARAGAPVAAPCDCLPAGPHRKGGAELTFWRYYAEDRSREVSSREIGQSLRTVHDALWELRAELPPLPPFTLQLEDAEELLERAASVPEMAERDRVFLRDLGGAVREAVGRRDFGMRPLHGECNAQQAMRTTSGVIWLDFEAACNGPIEWDLAVMDGEAIRAYGGGDRPAISLLRTARRLCIATWCWTQPERAPKVREAAEHHLAELRRVGMLL